VAKKRNYRGRWRRKEINEAVAKKEITETVAKKGN